MPSLRRIGPFGIQIFFFFNDDRVPFGYFAMSAFYDAIKLSACASTLFLPIKLPPLPLFL